MDIYDQILDGAQPESQPITESSHDQRDVYDGILDRQQAETDQRLRKTLDLVSQSNPDQAAQAASMSKQTGLPVEVVERNLQDVQRRLQVDNMQKIADSSPILKKQLLDPEFAKIAHDDVDNLGALEQTLQFGKNVGKAVATWPFAIGEGVAGLAENIADIHNKYLDGAAGNPYAAKLGTPVADMIHDIRQNQSDWMAYLTPKGDSNLESGIYSGIQSIGPSLASILTGNPATALLSMSAMTAGQSSAKAKDKGIDPLLALGYGAADGVVEGVTEQFGVGQFFKDMKAGSPIIKTLINQIVPEVAGEEAATVLQDFNEWSVLNKDAPLQSYLDDRPGATVQTLIATLVGSGGMVTLAKTVDALAGRNLPQADSAHQQAATIEQVNQLVAASKVMQRDPEAMKGFFDEALANNAAQNVYVDAQSFAQSGVAEQIAEALPDVKRQLPEALAIGGEIKIPMSDYMTRIAPTQYAQSLVDHIRVEGEEFSRAGAQQYMDSHAEELRSEVERVLTHKQADESFQASALVVKDSIKQQLSSVSRFTDKVNDHYASLLSNFYAVQADKFGKTPEELFQQYPVNVAATGLEGSIAFNQTEKTSTNVTNRWQKALLRVSATRMDYAPHFDTPSALKHFGVVEKNLPMPTRVLMQVMRKHKDIPGGVIKNLPALMADPLFIYPHKDGGLNIAIDAKTENGEPLVIGVREGRIRTITPLHNNENAIGQDRLIANVKSAMESGEKVYVRNEKALAEAKAFNLPQDRNNRVGRINKSGKRLVTRDDLVKQFGENFYQGDVTAYTHRRRAKRDDYTLDLFNVSADERKADSTETDTGGRLSRDDAPAGTYATRTQIVQENTRQLGTDQVNTPEEAAQALAYLSNSTVERFDALVTDKDGKPLTIVGSFKGAVDGGSVYTATISGEAFRIDGAANIWFAHNHPSGIAEFSAADRAIYNKLENVFRGSEITPRGMLALGGQQNEGRQWVFSDNPDVKEGSHSDVKGVTAKAKGKPKTTPVVERVYSEEGKLAAAINSPATAKSAAESLANGESGVMLLDNQHTPVAFIPLKSEESETLRTDGRMDALHRGLSMANAAAAIIVNQGDMTNNALMNLAGFFNSNDVRVLDVLDKNGDNMDSRAQAGLSFSRNTFNQGDDTNRGAFNPETRTITLLDKADLSTFLHESGHFFLEMQMDLASNLRKEDDLVGTTEAQKQLMSDTDALLRWFGLQSIEEWYSLDFEQKRSYHEQFAEGFEKYLSEGVAPSQSLQRIFASFRQWMIKVYEHVKDHFKDVELTDEVRGVFDRMLATDAEIKHAQESRSMMPLFADQEKSGMTPEEWADYQAAGKDSASTAMEQLALKGVRDMQWLQNARNRKLKELQRQHKELRREVRAEVEKEVLAHPIYQAWDFLTRKEAGGKLDAEAVREMDLPGMVTQRLRDFSMIRVEDGLHPDVVAELFGFSSGDHLVRELAAAEKSKDLIKQLTDERMLQNYGELSTPEAIQRAADAAIHNEARARFVTTEANALAKATGSLRILGNAAKEMAEGMVSRLKVRDIQPMQYSRAEIKAAKAAAKASQHGDIKQAAIEKRNQVLNMHLRKAAYEAEDEVDAGIRLIKRLQGAAAQGNMRGEFLLQLNVLVARFDLRTSLSLKAIDENKVPLAQWVEAEADRLSAVVPDLPGFMLDENYRKHYKDLTVEEFRALLEGIKQLEFLARREQKQYLEIRKQSFDEEREAVLQVLRKNYPEAFDEDGNPLGLQPEFVPTLSKALSNVGDKFIGEFINAENVIDLLERGQMGPVFESLFSRLTHRSDWKAERLSAIYQDLKPLFKAYTLKESRDFSRKGIFVKEIGTSITRENAVMVALLNGNAEGQHRLTNYGWGQHHVNAIISHLTDKDIDLVEGIWKLFDYSLWPELKALNERTRGKAPPKVEAAPYSINGRQVTGGYMRLKYDTDLDERAHRMDEGQAVKELLGGSLGMSSKTNQGTSTQRLEGVKLRPRLDLGVFSETVAESVHDLAYREAIADTMRMLNDRGIQSAIKSTQGVPAYRALVTRIREVAAPPRNPAGFADKALSVARKNTVIVMMSGVKTALQNFTGLLPAMAKVPPGLLMREVAKFYSPKMVERTRFAMEQSAYMRGRFDHFDRDLQDMTRQLTVNGHILPSNAVFLGLMGLVDRGVTVPVWTAAFTDGMHKFGNDNARATDYADHIVRQTQGSGRDVDLAATLSGRNQVWKVFTMFHSYFNAQLGLLVTLGAVAKHDAKTNPVLASAKFTAQFITVVVLPAVLTELLMHGLGDGDDPEEEAKRWAKVFIRYGAGMFPLLRDFVAAGMSEYATDSTYHAGFKLSPIESAVETAIKVPGAIYDIFTGEGTDSDTRTVIMGTSVVFGLPGKLISDTVRGTNAWLEGDAGPQAVILGPPPKH